MEAEVKTAIDDAGQCFGGISVLVNKAGINFVKYLEDTTGRARMRLKLGHCRRDCTRTYEHTDR